MHSVLEKKETKLSGRQPNWHQATFISKGGKIENYRFEMK